MRAAPAATGALGGGVFFLLTGLSSDEAFAISDFVHTFRLSARDNKSHCPKNQPLSIYGGINHLVVCRQRRKLKKRVIQPLYSGLNPALQKSLQTVVTTVNTGVFVMINRRCNKMTCPGEMVSNGTETRMSKMTGKPMIYQSYRCTTCKHVLKVRIK
jgi:hypothetical protein